MLSCKWLLVQTYFEILTTLFVLDYQNSFEESLGYNRPSLKSNYLFRQDVDKPQTPIQQDPTTNNFQ